MAEYPYMFWSLVLGIIWIILYIHRKDLRYEILFTSLLGMPFGLTQPLFVPEYWNPVVIQKYFGLFDIESLLWCFFLGGITASFYEEIFHFKLVKNRSKTNTHAYIVYVTLFLITIIAILVKYFTDLSVLLVSLLFLMLLIIYIFVTRPDLIRESILGGISTMILYMATLYFVDWVYPGFIENQWNFHGTLGVYILGAPLDEYIFAMVFGMSWSIIYEEIKNIKEKGGA